MSSYISNSVDCPNCGIEHKGKPFCTYDNGHHCFSCGFTVKYDKSYSPIIPKQYTIPDLVNITFNVNKFSLSNQTWLYKYYLDEFTIREYSIAQDMDDGALIFPNIQNEQIVGYTKRYNKDGRKIYHYGEKVPYTASTGSSRCLVVEDYVSCIRLAKYQDVVCLWGTKINSSYLEQLLQKYAILTIWLDNDHEKEINSGQLAYEKIVLASTYLLNKHKRLYGWGCKSLCRLDHICTDMDPKCYSPTELRSILNADR